MPSATSAADFLLAPEVQQLLKAVFAEPSKPYSTAALAKLTRLEPDDVQRTQEHLLACGILIQHPAEADGEAGPVSANTGFVFYQELRSIAFKSFALAEPLRAMLRSKFKRSVVRAVLLGEDASGAAEVLIVHGEEIPEATALSAACQKLHGSLGRHLKVHVMGSAGFAAYATRHQLAQRLAAGQALELIAEGETKAKRQVGGGGILQAAKARLAAITRR